MRGVDSAYLEPGSVVQWGQKRHTFLKSIPIFIVLSGAGVCSVQKEGGNSMGDSEIVELYCSETREPIKKFGGI